MFKNISIIDNVRQWWVWVISPISHKDPPIRSHGHWCWFTEVGGVIPRHELLAQHWKYHFYISGPRQKNWELTQRRLSFTPVELDDLMEAHIRDPGVSLRVNLEPVGHVEQAGPETGLHFPLVGINSEDRVLLDELSGQNIFRDSSLL